MAESLFSWTCQSPLRKDDTMLLIGYLEKVTLEADGTLDSVNLYLLMALLYCLDVGFLEHGTEDRDGMTTHNFLPLYVFVVVCFLFLFYNHSIALYSIDCGLFPPRTDSTVSFSQREAVCHSHSPSPTRSQAMENAWSSSYCASSLGPYSSRCISVVRGDRYAPSTDLPFILYK